MHSLKNLFNLAVNEPIIKPPVDTASGSLFECGEIHASLTQKSCMLLLSVFGDRDQNQFIKRIDFGHLTKIPARFKLANNRALPCVNET